MVLAKRLTLFSLVGMLHWLFGNLYEAVVIAPNWVVDTPQQLDRLHALFARTSPTTYFVPITFLAPLLVWVAWAVQRRAAAAAELKRASLFALLATAVNAFIVATIITRIFGDGYTSEAASELHGLCVRWNLLNTLRMALTAATAGWLFAAFRKLDRLPA